MTPSQLKYKVEEQGGLLFFSRNNMKFAGDTMKNFGVRSNRLLGVDVWELYRKTPTLLGFYGSFFFCKKTFKRIYLSNP